MTRNSIKIKISSQLGNVALVGTAINGIFKGFEGWEPFADEAEIAVVEAINNSIEHAYGFDKDWFIEIDLAIADDEIEIKISDFGSPLKELTERKLEFDEDDIDSLPEGGMGLFLIQQMMDTVEYSSDKGRNTLKLMKKKSSLG